MAEILKLSKKDVIERLRELRESNERSSEAVDIYSLCKLDTIFNKNEKPIVYEQIIYSALDCHYYMYAKNIIGYLYNEFPGSLRVMRHHAAYLEAMEKYDEATKLLDVIIKEDETNSAARKRRVAILKAQGLNTEAIKELVDYLKKFMSDVEAWQELCSQYLAAGELARAAFCAEEVLLHQPHSHLQHQRLADIRYTMGGLENLELAKSYYCHALKLNSKNMRAILGLFLTTNSLLGLYKSSGASARRKEASRLCAWAQAGAAAAAPLAGALQALAITE